MLRSFSYSHVVIHTIDLYTSLSDAVKDNMLNIFETFDKLDRYYHETYGRNSELVCIRLRTDGIKSIKLTFN